MKLANRLLACASLVRQGAVAADIGTDHGYLPIYLLEQNICPRVIAADLRKMPLEAAKRSARRAGITKNIEFYLSDGLEALPVQELDTVICAGMGGDCIIGILDRAREVWNPKYQLIFQPQSSVSDLRRWLGEHGFSIIQEKLAQDGKFIYTVMEVQFGGGTPGTPGTDFLPKVLLNSGDPLLGAYYTRVKDSLTTTVSGLHRAKQASPETVAYYETAMREVTEMGEKYGIGT